MEKDRTKATMPNLHTMYECNVRERMHSLPKWAQIELERLYRDTAALRQEIARLSTPDEGEQFVAEDPLIDSVIGLGHRTVKLLLKRGYIAVRPTDDGEGVNVSFVIGRVVVVPLASNSIIVRPTE